MQPSLAAFVLVAAAAAGARAALHMELAHVSEAVPEGVRHVETNAATAAACASEPAPAWCYRVVVRNGRDEEVRLDVRRTALEGSVLLDGVFSATDAETGKALKYIGAKGKRSTTAAKPENLLVVPPLATVAAVVDLSDAFRFEAGRRYVVEVNDHALGPAHRLAAAQNKVARTRDFLASADSVLPVVRRARTGRAVSQASVDYDGCSSSERAAIVDARDIALTALATSVDYITTEQCSGPDYYDKFGKPSQNRFKEVSETLNNIQDLLDDGDYGFDCTFKDCSEGVYAFVYPNDPKYIIHLCDVFWEDGRAALARDSRPGTIIHEASHFDDIGGTDDHAYGIDNVRDLAKNDPYKAVNNADSMEYFNEDIPDKTGGSSDPDEAGGPGPGGGGGPGCDACYQTNTTCDSCTTSEFCGFCDSTNECAGALLGCETWFPDSDCIEKEESGANTLAAGALVAALVAVATAAVVMRA